MHLLGEYYDEQEWALNFHVPHYWVRKESLVNIQSLSETKALQESMASLYLNCAKYDRMVRECKNYWGADWAVDAAKRNFDSKYANCNKVVRSFWLCKTNNQWYYQTKKYMPELFNAHKGKNFLGNSSYQYIQPEDF